MYVINTRILSANNFVINDNYLVKCQLISAKEIVDHLDVMYG